MSSSHMRTKHVPLHCRTWARWRVGTKSDLVGCLEDQVRKQENAADAADAAAAAASPAVEVIILDGAAIIYMLPLGPAKTFNDYASQVFLPYITSHLQHTSRVNIIWDEYFTDSLKAGTRKKRGKGIRRREPSSSIPGNWQTFLRTDENTMELFNFLATRIATTDTDKQVITTHHKYVVCTQARDVAGRAPCSHEEADTRMLIHVEDAVRYTAKCRSAQ